MKPTHLTLALCLLTILSCSKYTEQTAEQQRPATSEVIDEIWIDVRTPAEFDTGHLDGAINIPHTEIAERISAVVQEKNRPIKLYCRSGHRSGIAQKVLAELGYTNLTNEGGYEDILQRTN